MFSDRSDCQGPGDTRRIAALVHVLHCPAKQSPSPLVKFSWCFVYRSNNAKVFRCDLMWYVICNVICNLVVAVVVISNMICDMWYVYVSDKWYVICVMIDVFCILNSELCHETSWTLTMQMLICATIAGCHLSSSFDHFRGLQSTVLRHVESIHNSQGMILVVGCNLLPDQKTCTHSPIDPNSNGWQGMHVTGSNHQPQLTLSLCHCHCQCLCVWQSDTSIWDYLYVYQSCWITVWYWYWYWLLIRLNSGVCGQLHATTKQNFTVHFFSLHVRLLAKCVGKLERSIPSKLENVWVSSNRFKCLRKNCSCKMAFN